jgi:alkylation response protein AidB-like acyl-CoA dehydrogenase
VTAVTAGQGGSFAVVDSVPETFLDARARAVRKQLLAVIEEEVAPRAARCDESGCFAGPGYQALASAGLAGLLFPRQLGGTGDTAVTYAMAVAEIAARCPSTSLIYMTQMHAGHPILLAGSPEQQRTWIPRLCSGLSYGSLAITEPDAGSDVASMTTTAIRDGDHYLLNGAKTFITSGNVADIIVLFATVNRSAGRRGITAFALPGDAPGLSRGRTLRKLGMHGSPTAELFLDDVRLPTSARLGADGAGWALSMQSVIKSRLSAAAQGIGIATRALHLATAASHASGRPRQEIAADLASWRTRLLTGRTLLYATASAIDADAPELTAQVSAMKLWCTDLGVGLADWVCDLLGPRGDLAECEAERLLRDAKVTQIYDGTNEIQRLIIARDTARQYEEQTR